MRTITFWLLLATISTGYSQGVITNAYYYIFYNKPEGKDFVKTDEGETMFHVGIGKDTILLDVIPKQIHIIQTVESYETFRDGTKVTMLTKDQDGVGCEVILVVLPEHKEISFRYLNEFRTFLLKDDE